jgi:hypothetical protein
MTTILTPMQANPPDLSSRFRVSLIGGLAALVIGVAVLLSGSVLPDIWSHSDMVSAEAAIRTAAAPGDAGQDAAGMGRSAGSLHPTVNWFAADRRSPALTTPRHIGADPETALARGTRAETVHLAATQLAPDSRDVRWDLMEIAASQRHGWTVRCPCPVYPIDVPGRGPR